MFARTDASGLTARTPTNYPSRLRATFPFSITEVVTTLIIDIDAKPQAVCVAKCQRSDQLRRHLQAFYLAFVFSACSRSASHRSAISM